MKLILVLILILLLLLIVVIYYNREHFVFKKVPLAQNTNIDKYDLGLLKNIRKNRNLYSIKNEYKLNQMSKILKKIKDKSPYYGLEFKKQSFVLPSIMVNLFLSKLNSIAYRENIDRPFQKFNLHQFELIESYYNQNYDIKKFELFIKVYRKNKDYYFNTYLEVIQNSYNEFFFIDCKVMGILMEHSLVFGNRFKPYEKKYYDSIDKSYNFKTLKKFIRKKKDEMNDYKCFLKNSRTKFDCISPDPNGLVGVWDKPCKSNFECPFYKKNKNYPNNRGRCINGKCELPIGCERVGYTFFAEKPLCHNCNKGNCSGIDCNRCCDNSSKKDYAFLNDFSNRYQFRNILKAKGLKVNGLNL